MISDDEYLERIVAAIQTVSTAGAEVQWNEVINDRQFDVVVRFKLGTLSYLVLIEVKNRTRKAEAADLDGFVTKARDQNANKAVFVTAAGFQEGAIEVAKKHGIELFTVTFDVKEFRFPQLATFIALRNKNAPEGTRPEFNIGEPILVVNIERATLIYADGSKHAVPSEQSQMNYYFQQTKLSDGRTLNDLFQNLPIPNVQLEETRNEEVRFDRPLYIEPPDSFFFPAGDVQAVTFKVTGRNARPLRGNIKFDPSILTMPVVYTNAFTGEETRFALESLPLGVKRVSPGNFYFTCHPLSYFYCEAIKGDLIHWSLVESFQAGDLLQVKTTQLVKYSQFYIPVTDTKILNRLQARLDKLTAR